MKPATPDNHQTMQRVKVGMIGLAAVVLLIGLASAIFSLMTRERPIAVAGAPKAEVVATIAVTGNASEGVNEPLAELGVAPGAVVPTNTAAPAR